MNIFHIDSPLTTFTGDTLTYTLGAMKPETVNEEVITADAAAKQLALNKVSGGHNSRLSSADSIPFSRFRLRKHIFNCCPLRCNIAIEII